MSVMLLNVAMMAQSPQAINYQGLARDNAGNILANQIISLRLSVLSGTASGTVVYAETHLAISDANGLFALQIGQGTVITGLFSSINWGSENHFLKVEIDQAGGSSYTLVGTNQFTSVPYSLYALNGLPQGQSPGDMLYWDGTAWLRIPAGIDGQVLAMEGNMPKWGSKTYPLVSTTKLQIINTSSAYCEGNIASDGGDGIIARGICWDTLSNPTISDNHTVEGTGVGAFASLIPNLVIDTVYYFRAYATNSLGTSYGNEIELTMQGGVANLVTTVPAMNSFTSATSGGTITSDGGDAITSRGICYATTPNPTTTTGTVVYSGSGIGSFTAGMISLLSNTTYFVKSFAINSSGTWYGNELTLLTPSYNCTGTFTVTHNTGSGVAPINKTVNYAVVDNIPGEPTKCWIAQNLGADHQATSVDDATEESAGWYWQFNRKQGFKHDGGNVTPATGLQVSIGQYSNWTAANDPCTIELGSGWRIPTNSEWSNVDAGGSWDNWTFSWNSGLKLHAAGYIYSDGSLWYRGSGGYFYSSIEQGWEYGFLQQFNYYQNSLYITSKATGCSIRCLREF